MSPNNSMMTGVYMCSKNEYTERNIQNSCYITYGAKSSPQRHIRHMKRD